MTNLATTTLAFGLGGFNAWELVIILVLGLLLFGKRLPEVGKSLGKGIVEFKKGLKGIEDDVEAPPTSPRRRSQELPDRDPSETPLSDRRVSRSDTFEDEPVETPRKDI
jgi:sec-independent protein translocase protein TatA